MSRLLLSVVIGVILLGMLSWLDIVINGALTGKKQTKTATLITNNGAPILDYSNDCSVIPKEYQQYCDNIQVKFYGHIAVVATDIKNVPPNPYIGSLGGARYEDCVNGCGNDPPYYSFENDNVVASLILWELIFGLLACTYAAYWALGKYSSKFSQV